MGIREKGAALILVYCLEVTAHFFSLPESELERLPSNPRMRAPPSFFLFGLISPAQPPPSQREMSTQSRANAGPASRTLNRHRVTSRACLAPAVALSRERRESDRYTKTSLLNPLDRDPDPVDSRQTRDIDPKLVYCWATVADGGPTFSQHWVDVSCLPGGSPQGPRIINRKMQDFHALWISVAEF